MACTPKEQPKPVFWASMGGLLGPLTLLLSTGHERIKNHLPLVEWPKFQVFSRIPKVKGIFQVIPVFLPSGPASQTSHNFNSTPTAGFCPE